MPAMPANPLSRRAFIAGAAALPLWTRAARTGQAPPLLLAREAAAGIDPVGYLVSEKYDGMRAIWDGTVLRSRSGLPIAAPRGFVDRLPPTPLDGELWPGRGRFEWLSTIVRHRRPLESQWQSVRYMVFELPDAPGDFSLRVQRIRSIAGRVGWSQLVAVDQDRLTSARALQRRLDTVVAGGGEGLMLHRADAAYTVGRSEALLKLKPLHDAEGRVIAHLVGRGRHAKRLGALRLRTDAGVEFALGSGLSDAQRDDPPALGSIVSFTHRGWTANGVPRFASFLRVRED
jgi:DNA ligase-1